MAKVTNSEALARELVWLVSSQCRFNTHSGLVQGATSECINKWNNKLMFLSLSNQNFFKIVRILNADEYAE